MIRRPQLVGGIAMLAAIALVADVRRCHVHGAQPSLLQAQAVNPFQDSDGDLLPDNLEWVSLSDPASGDSDGDGRDDFIEAVQSTSMHLATPGQPLDQEMRVLLSSNEDRPTGERFVWMHCLFRFASGRMDLDWFFPFIAINGVSVPIADIFGRTPMDLRVRAHPTEGMYAIVSLRLARERDFARSLPCTVNARAAISGRFLSSSIYAYDSFGTVTTLMPLGKDGLRGALVAQSLPPHNGSSNTFFSGNRVCVQTLTLTGHVPGGYLCEVETSACQTANALRCASDCAGKVGNTLIAPDGLGAITGG